MFFYIAKGLWFLLQPSTLIALLIGYGAILIWTGWARWGRRFVTIGAILLLLAGLSPLGNALILPLEDRFPRANLDDPPPPTGFVILGGAEDSLVATARRVPALNEAGDRMVEAAKGVTFGVLCEMVATYAGEDEAEVRAATYLKGWVDTGMLAGFEAG